MKIDIASYQAKKKEKSFKRLMERYLGKRELLATWDEYPGEDLKYRNDLKRRVTGHKRDILTRSGENPE
jgi:hypothetical protein